MRCLGAEVQTTKGEAGDNRIGDQVRTVCVVNDEQRCKREDGGEEEGEGEGRLLGMGLGATKGDPRERGILRKGFESVNGALLPRLSRLHATNCRFRQYPSHSFEVSTKYPEHSRCMRINAPTTWSRQSVETPRSSANSMFNLRYPSTLPWREKGGD